MFRRLLAIGTAIIFATSLSQTTIAQGFGSSRSGGMGSGGFGSGGFGSGGMGSGGFGSGGFGSSGFGSSGFGSSGFGSGGFGSGGFGSSGFGGGFGNSGFGNSGFGNSGFGGGYGNSGYGGNTGGQNFVGRDAGDMQAVWGQMGRASTQFFNSMNRNMGRNNNNNSRRQTSKAIQNPPQPMRVQVKVAFDAPRAAPSQLVSGIQTRLARIADERKWVRPNLRMEGDTAVLSGVAASESERAVMGQLLAIEPGVREVRNEMTIAQPASAAPVAQPPGS